MCEGVRGGMSTVVLEGEGGWECERGEGGGGEGERVAEEEKRVGS